MDDVDAGKYVRKLNGMTNTAVFYNPPHVEIMGAFDAGVGYSSIEIRSSEVMMIDIK